jgi:FkbH-like protein
MMNRLEFLPKPAQRLNFPQLEDPEIWLRLRHAAQHQLSFTEAVKLDRLLTKLAQDKPAGIHGVLRLKLAILSSATVEHLIAGLQIAGARHNIVIKAYTHAYGSALQELDDPESNLAVFQPDVVLVCFPYAHLFGSGQLAKTREDVEDRLSFASGMLQDLRDRARAKFDCSIIQQTVLPTELPLVGSHEFHLPGAPAQLVAQLNERLRQQSVDQKFAILAIDDAAVVDGLAAWHDRALWHRAKQEISPAAGQAYGEMVLQIIDAQRGRAAKCLVLDLDNTLWGGVIGDDGLDGIKLGQGSGVGESFVAFQTYAKRLSERGIILAVCSKNDEENALLPFQKHPEMVLRREDIACFVANWTDKASNLREIARQLNIGLDALVFCDDNPFEREQVRDAVPEVRVPELPEDPSFWGETLAAAGYFESVALTADDFSRVAQYRSNAEREKLKTGSGNIDDYLRSLDMELKWAAADLVNVERITQLINKTNQFNLTTKRYDLAQVQTLMNSPESLVLSFRLLDRLGDNGIICIIIGHKSDNALLIDAWLMSCRVLGRGVEKATLGVLAAQAAGMGATRLSGRFIPSEKNKMVADHYEKLGFSAAGQESGGITVWSLDLAGYLMPELPIRLTQVEQ